MADDSPEETSDDERSRIGILSSLKPSEWTAVGWIWFGIGLIGVFLPTPFNLISGFLLFPPLIRYFQDSYFRMIDQWASCIMAIFLFVGAFLGVQENVDQYVPSFKLIVQNYETEPREIRDDVQVEQKVTETEVDIEEIPLVRRKRIYRELLHAHDKASRKASKKYPLRIGEVSPGFTFKTKESSQREGTCLSPGTKIKIVERDKQNESYRFLAKAYRNDCKIFEEWLDEPLLRKQELNLLTRNLSPRSQLENKLTRKFEARILSQYSLSDRQLTKITLEGIRKDWSASS